MFKSKYWSGVYVATMGWWGFLGLITLLRRLDLDLSDTTKVVLVPLFIVLVIISALVIGRYTEEIQKRRSLFWFLHSLLGFAAVSGLVMFVLRAFEKQPAPLAIFLLALPAVYALVGWPFYRIAKRVRLRIEEIKRSGANVGLWTAAKIMGGDFGLAIFNEVSRGRRWIFLTSYLVFTMTFVLLFPDFGNLSFFWRTMFWALGLLSFTSLLVILYAEVLEKSGAKQELKLARDMQMHLMPKEDPVVLGFNISGICVPASEVGGDFFDYVWLDRRKTKLGIALADVSGKAMKAAMTAVMTSGMLYSEVQKSQRPREILARINRPLYLRSDKRVFTAMSFGTLDVRQKRLVYSNAGQTVPVLVRNGKTSYLKTRGVRLPLGVKEDLQYAEIQMRLKRDDIVVFYTDGISEARNASDEQYGPERLEQLLKKVSGSSAKEVRERIFEDVRNFAGTTQQHDDMTVVVVKVT